MTTLTPRQQTVCDLLVEGLTAKQIAARLGVSHHTIETLAKVVRKKYGAHNRIHLVRIVLEGEPAK